MNCSSLSVEKARCACTGLVPENFSCRLLILHSTPRGNDALIMQAADRGAVEAEKVRQDFSVCWPTRGAGRGGWRCMAEKYIGVPHTG